MVLNKKIKKKYLRPFSFYPSISAIVPLTSPRIFWPFQMTTILIYQCDILCGILAGNLTRFYAFTARF